MLLKTCSTHTLMCTNEFLVPYTVNPAIHIHKCKKLKVYRVSSGFSMFFMILFYVSHFIWFCTWVSKLMKCERISHVMYLRECKNRLLIF